MSGGKGLRVVLVSVPSEAKAVELGRRLVDERLAACVNVIPGITSIFRWEGKREDAAEALLVMKTRAERYPALEQRILELHPYSVPEVLALPVTSGSAAYTAWLRESVASVGGGEG